MKYLNKSFSIERVKAEYLAKKFGTPIYCYSYKKLKKNVIKFKNNFKSFNPLICFSVKSNTNLSLLREIRKLGCGADVVSIGELMKALKAGVNSKKIVFYLVFSNFSQIFFLNIHLDWLELGILFRKL